MNSAYGLDSLPDIGWWTRAACLGRDPQLWDIYSTRLTEDHQAALNICHTCPVGGANGPCFADAARHHTDGQIRAGAVWQAGRALPTTRCPRCGRYRLSRYPTTSPHRHCNTPLPRPATRA